MQALHVARLLRHDAGGALRLEAQGGDLPDDGARGEEGDLHASLHNLDCPLADDVHAPVIRVRLVNNLLPSQEHAILQVLREEVEKRLAATHLLEDPHLLELLKRRCGLAFVALLHETVDEVRHQVLAVLTQNPLEVHLVQNPDQAYVLRAEGGGSVLLDPEQAQLPEAHRVLGRHLHLHHGQLQAPLQQQRRSADRPAAADPLLRRRRGREGRRVAQDSGQAPVGGQLRGREGARRRRRDGGLETALSADLAPRERDVEPASHEDEELVAGGALVDEGLPGEEEPAREHLFKRAQALLRQPLQEIASARLVLLLSDPGKVSCDAVEEFPLRLKGREARDEGLPWEPPHGARGVRAERARPFLL
mmetsp:Transcript_23000/g.58077  ORF Transcript_23000/g.58077 Transcript_23000/m.58077 type:complete len:364 (-) Transcript_23000:720-1811(-)